MRLKVIFPGLCGLLLLAGTAFSQPTPKPVTTVEGVKEYELANGLRVLLMPDASQTNIAVNIVYKVGSRHEGYGESGMAHLLEHMLFKQCKKFTDIKKAIADKGASANGTTWYDRTNYYEVLSASDENLRWAIDMEADRMVNSKILAEELKKEFSVVRNEFEIGENYPSNILGQRILSTMFLWHNYGKSTIGSKEDIERVQADNLRAFYKKHYQPDNAILIIAGKFDEKKALSYVQQYFGPIPRPSRKLQPTYTVEPVQDGERFVSLRRTGDIQYIGVGYHTPAVADRDYVANDAFIQAMVNEPSGLLYKKLVETKLASRVSGYSMTLYDPGFTYFEIEVPKEKSIDSARHALLEVLDGGNLSITEEDLERARNSMVKGIEDVMARTLDFAVALTEFVGAGDWRLWYLNRDRIDQLTLSDVQAVAKRYYKPSNRTVGVFIPDSNPDRTVVRETPDIARLLEGYKGREGVVQKANFENTIPNIRTHTIYGTLANGGKYALLEKPTNGDKISASLTLRFGNEQDLQNRSTAGEVLADLLKTGTTTRTRKEISDELDRIKTTISFVPEAGGLTVNLGTDRKNLPAALALLDDMLRNPRFDSAEFSKSIIDKKAVAEAGRNEPSNLASEKLGKMLTPYAPGHPLYVMSTDEYIASLDNLKLDEVKKFYADFYGGDNSISSFVGEIDRTQVTAFLEKALGSWKSRTAYREIDRRYFTVKGNTETINTPDKTNAMLIGGLNMNISRKHPDYPAAVMANELLGGGAFLSSRIPMRLRENEGMSYGAGSFMNVQYKYDVGTWGVYAYFNPTYKGRLDSAIHQEMDKALKAGFTADELKKSIISWEEQNRTSLGSNDNLAYILKSYLANDRDLLEYSRFEEKIKALTLQQVNEALRKHFDKSKLVMIYGGDFQKKDEEGKPVEKKAF